MFEVVSVVGSVGTVVVSFFFNMWLLKVTLPFIVGASQ